MQCTFKLRVGSAAALLLEAYPTGMTVVILGWQEAYILTDSE